MNEEGSQSVSYRRPSSFLPSDLEKAIVTDDNNEEPSSDGSEHGGGGHEYEPHQLADHYHHHHHHQATNHDLDLTSHHHHSHGISTAMHNDHDYYYVNHDDDDDDDDTKMSSLVRDESERQGQGIDADQPLLDSRTARPVSGRTRQKRTSAMIISPQEQSLDDDDDAPQEYDPAAAPGTSTTAAAANALLEAHHHHVDDLVDDGLGVEPLDDEVIEVSRHEYCAAPGVVVAVAADRIEPPPPPMRCIICGADNGKPLLRFHPVDHDLLVSAAAPAVTSFTATITLHVFCGRTASILPNINRPDLEILTKAGIKNKHGIGQEVNGALSRTRCATVAESPGAKEKEFYLVREFEANLAAVRNSFVVHQPPPEMTPLVLNNYVPVYQCVGITAQGPRHRQPQSQQPHPMPVYRQVEAFMDSMQHHHQLVAADLVPSPPRKRSRSVRTGPLPKVQCGCGGTYTNPSSMRNHVKTKRHIRWEETRDSL